MLAWWQAASDDERRRVNAIPTVQRVSGGAGVLSTSDLRVRDVLLETLFASRSELLLLPVQDVFGWRDRINEPATVTDANWTFRLPWPSDRLIDVPEAVERQATLRQWSTRYDRLGEAGPRTAPSPPAE